VAGFGGNENSRSFGTFGHGPAEAKGIAGAGAEALERDGLTRGGGVACLLAQLEPPLERGLAQANFEQDAHGYRGSSASQGAVRVVDDQPDGEKRGGSGLARREQHCGHRGETESTARRGCQEVSPGERGGGVVHARGFA